MLFLELRGLTVGFFFGMAVMSGAVDETLFLLLSFLVSGVCLVIRSVVSTIPILAVAKRDVRICRRVRRCDVCTVRVVTSLPSVTRITCAAVGTPDSVFCAVGTSKTPPLSRRHISCLHSPHSTRPPPPRRPPQAVIYVLRRTPIPSSLAPRWPCNRSCSSSRPTAP